MGETERPPCVLVVDDNPDNLDLLVGFLEPLKYEIGIATSGESALEVVPLLHPDLILLDIVMPGIDGYETCRRLKANPNHQDIPVIFITAKTEIRDLKLGFDVGGVDFIRKPIQREEILARVQTHISLRQLTKRLDFNNRQLSAILAVVMEGTFCVDRQGRISNINPAALSQLECTETELEGQHFGLLLPTMGPDQETWLQSPVYAICDGGGKYYSEGHYFRCKSGRLLPVEFTVSALTDKQGNTFGAIVAFRDITEKKKSEERLLSLMSTDQLTGLVNWREFRKHLAEVLEESGRRDRPVAVLLLDLDDFRDINDSLGHDTGDLLLTMVADRLRSFLPGEIMITRLGGDEFALLVDEATADKDPEQLARQILEQMQIPFVFLGNHIFLSTSIGIVTNRDTRSSAADMIRAADVAVFRAKELDKGTYAFYTADRQRQITERLRLTNSLREGIRNKELLPYFQPIVDVDSGRIVGAEALVRWDIKSEAVLPPERFIQVAESSGLISEVGDLVLESVCTQLQHWKTQGVPLTVSINVSAKQLKNPEFPQHFFSTLDRYSIDPSMLALELTESTLMDKPERAIQTFKQFQKQHVEIAIDDFGTGFSSLSYLTRLNANILKIDRGFITKMGDDPATESIVLTIIAMAKGLGMKVVAEGVETERQKHFLVTHGCNMLQGYLFGEPMEADAFTQMLLKNSLASK